MTERRGDWMQTYTGKAFWPLDPNPEDVDIEDVAHALSMLCRFGGHCTRFYSVADHCIRVAQLLEKSGESKEVVFWGLLHDATEAYAVDIPRPLKRFLPEYKKVEHDLMAAIIVRFGLLPEEPPQVKNADNILLVTEARDLMVTPPMGWSTPALPLRARIKPRSIKIARRDFLAYFERLIAP